MAGAAAVRALWMPGNVLHNAQGPAPPRPTACSSINMPPPVCRKTVARCRSRRCCASCCCRPAPSSRSTTNRALRAPDGGIAGPAGGRADREPASAGVRRRAHSAVDRRHAEQPGGQIHPRAVGAAHRHERAFPQPHLATADGHELRPLAAPAARDAGAAAPDAGRESVQTVALDLGYESASGFVTMFRKAVGKPPARYLAERNASERPWAAQLP